MGMYNDKYKELGLTIAYHRKLRGYNQEQLAKQIGISRTHLSNIEAAGTRVGISVDVIFRIAEALNIKVSKLFVNI
ncbi:helix-turn-helix domain-containing protein [Lactonifactor sp. BIOML-A3]|nr:MULTISPECIES: helix-turn-helix transcriptional regulator [unclassified Lactonifactor]MSA02215.1 helix-turn-helix domain-containing protein [Lactonifactor sp. BIOML-A5]MSA07999.1 helix-turn-helix domain-containing protein [Lactonifactor sp. BIOML-A4]MSA12615.1 helix-turn-helix domain-containing protein [Lactonifactor sp. BIOML-A3]MSA16683.1 helix-turn-helix domain-containing protein [Lactonifactor sp. BIOML-A2]MSA37618.1 helix-turn-helix domain-containing protein [Lactonifactor sp. BIOML-A1]